jgi:hypothetical protein
MHRRATDPRQVAWKFLQFYDLSPPTLRRLTVQYGLRESGGFRANPGRSGQPLVRLPLSVAIACEADPRVRRCLRHQAWLAAHVLSFRARGLRAQVRGWLVALEGGKAPRQRLLWCSRQD